MTTSDATEGAYVAPSLRSPFRAGLEQAVFDATADGAATAMLIWEKPSGEVVFRTVPNSPALLIGLHDMLGRALADMLGDGEGGDDEE